MNLYLFLIPGALFLLVIFFRVGLPYLRNPPWKRMIDNARYYRHMEKPEKSDEILEKAVRKHENRPEVYTDYFLNHSHTRDLQHRINILRKGYEKTGDTALGFFLGNAYLEHGDFPTARKYLDSSSCREYMTEHKIPLYAQLLFEEGDFSAAKSEFIDFYRKVFDITEEEEDVLSDLSAQELILYALILKALEQDWRTIMKRIPKSSFHSDMSWKDYLSLLKDEYSQIEPAETGIGGDPSIFNRRRNEYYRERIKLVESYL